MNKKMLLIFIVASLFMTMFFCSCSKNTNELSKETLKITEPTSSPKPEVKLPANFTIDKVKSALLEYINYRLWLYPATIKENLGDKSVDNYIDKSIDVEIRVYNNSSGKSVYAHTSIGQWLAVFKNVNEFVYCDGQASEGEYGWPNNIESYEVIEKYSIIIPEPHKPNYGTSQRKDKMIAAFESKVKAACEDFYKGSDKYYDEWENVDVYIADFYEYETGAHAWLCRQDGSITDFPVGFAEENNEFKVQPGKGYTVKKINNYDDFSGHLFKRDINDSVEHFKCNIK